MSLPPAPDLDLNPFMDLPDCTNISAYHERRPSNILPCDEFYRKIIALRIYFSFIVFNFLFIVSTTLYFIYRNLSANKCYNTRQQDSTDISKMWQMYSLKKRGLFGTVLGALGHLVLSSTVLLYQVIVSFYTCDIYLFGPMVGFYIWTYAIVWRTLRLHLMLQLQQKFMQQSSSSTPIEPESFMGRMMMTMSTKQHIALFSIPLFILAIIIVLTETLGTLSNCSFVYGNYLILALVLFFFVVVVPFIFWYLRHDEDAHGIRQEIWITLVVGVPCCIIFVVWQVLFESPSTARPAGTRGVFGPANWIIIVTTANHIMAVVLPLFKRLSIQKKSCHKNEEDQKPCFELTTACLERALRDPRQRQTLQTWAIKDFSVENILFYEKYLELEASPILGKSNLKELLSFYNTFIVDQAPLQVNISYAARSEIDAALGPLCHKVYNTSHVQEGERGDGIPEFLQVNDTLDELHLRYDLLYSSTTPIDLTKLKEPKNSGNIENIDSSDMSTITLEVFEAAKKEVFWDIFSGLFPKVVAASH